MIPFSIVPETDVHESDIEKLHAEAFGPGRFARAAFRLREQGPHDPLLSFVALGDGKDAPFLGSVRMTWIETEETGARGLLLGPLAVLEGLKGKGVGKGLLRHAVGAAGNSGAGYILLVGDKPYYWPFGFNTVEPESVSMPGPVDQERLLVCTLQPGAPSPRGAVRWAEKPL